jgi:lipopolysaccharide transport system permease protein
VKLVDKKLNMAKDIEGFDLVVTPRKHLFDINLYDIIRYRDLLMMFVKRDIITVYKQTILGPTWFFLQPILTMLTYVVIFGQLAGLSTDSLPPALFYISGIIFWNYFSDCFTKTSDTFIINSGIFGKVYFPRLIVPLSIVISSLLKFLIQSGLFIILFLYYYFKLGTIHPNATAFLIPVYILLMAGLGLGLGIIFTSLTTKYRDLKFLLQFGIQLMMYASPIIYPMNSVSGKLAIILKLNPVTHIIEGFKYGMLGQGQFSWLGLAYSTGVMLVLLLIGVVIFNKTEQNFMDTV